jgi:ligand-binding sensor domain-containing protein
VQAFTTKQGLVSNGVTLLAATRDGTVWTPGAPLTSVRPDGVIRQYGAADGLGTANVTTLFTEPDGTLWVGAADGALAWYDGSRFHAVDWAKPPQRGTILAIARDAAGHLWIGATSGLFELEGERTSTVVAHSRFARAVTDLSSGPLGLWAATEDSLVRIDRDSVKTYGPSDGLLHDTILTLAQDDQGSVWVGTRAGMAQLRPRSIRSYTRVDGLPSKVATCVLESRRGDLWVGTNTGVARRRDGRWTTFSVRDGVPDGLIRSLAEGADGTIWIGTVDGLARFRDERITAIPSPERPYFVRSLATDTARALWIGTYENGVDRYEHGAFRRVWPRAETCARARALFLLPVSDRELWMGGSSALVHARDGRLECQQDASEPSRDDVRHIAPAAEGGFWIGSIGGLGRITPEGKIERFTGPRAPFDTPNYAVLDDGASLWCSTPQGIFQVRKDDLARAGGLARARGFGVGDGLASSVMTGDGQPSGWRGRDGRLYFTSADGLAVVEPGLISTLPAPPPVFIERLVADGRTVAASSRLPAGTRNVEVHFGAVSFHLPELVSYRYRLDGFDADWHEGGSRRVAAYTNLPARRYRFRVVAVDNTGVWNEAGAALEFELPPRLRDTLWFRSLMVLGLLAGVFAAHRLRLAHLNARAAQLQREVDQSLANIQVLRGLLPICAWCRRVREDSGYWQKLEDYVMERSDARFSLSLCADCAAQSETTPRPGGWE